MGLFHLLHDAVTDAFAPAFGPADSRALIALLELHLPALKTPFHVSARTAASRQALQSGLIEHNGKHVKLDTIAKDEIIALSDLWKMDEAKTADVYLNARNSRSYYNCSGAQAAMLEFHSEREAQIEVLRCIVKGAQMPEALSPYAVHPFQDFVTQLMRTSFASKAVAALESLTTHVQQLTDSAGVNTTSQCNHSSIITQQLRQKEIDFSLREQKLLTLLLIELAPHGLGGDIIIQLFKVLTKVNDNHTTKGLNAYLLIVVLAALRRAASHNDLLPIFGSSILQPLTTNARFIKEFDDALVAAFTNALCGVVRIAWAIFLAHVPAEHQSILLALSSGKDSKTFLDDISYKGIMAGAFPWLIKNILAALKIQNGDPSALSVDSISYPSWLTDQESHTTTTPSTSLFSTDTDDDLMTPLYVELEYLALQFISHAGKSIRQIKDMDEKALLDAKSRRTQAQKQPQRYFGATISTASGITSPTLSSVTGPNEAYRPYESFLLFLSLLFADRLDAGLVFWESKSNRPYFFLKWAVEMSHSRTRAVFYDMLASLARGPRCAAHAFHFLQPVVSTSETGAKPALIDWSRMFTAIRYYVDQIHQSMQRPMGSAFTPGDMLNPDDTDLINSLLRLLKQVVRYSVEARHVIIENRDYEALRILFDFLACSVPLKTKAALLDCIAAFAADDGLLFSNTISLSIWQYLEDIQIVPIRGSFSTFSRSITNAAWRLAPNTGGLMRDLEDLESRNQTYPETRAFIRLLDALIHVPSGSSSLGVASSFPLLLTVSGQTPHSIPDNLGAGYRAPGIHPYIDFLMDQVFLRAGARGYLIPSEKWQVYAGCLQVLEKCLLTFDLTSLLSHINNTPLDDPTSLPLAMDTSVRPSGLGGVSSISASAGNDHAHLDCEMLARHPGFDIMCRLLSGHRLLDGLLAIVSAAKLCMQSMDDTRHLADFRISIRLALRIMYRALKLQKVFLEVLIPALREQNVSRILPSGLTYLDQCLVVRKESPVDIAYLIFPLGDVPEDEIAVLSVKLLTYLSVSPAFSANGTTGTGSLNPLVTIFQSAETSDVIVAGYVDRLRLQLANESDRNDGENHAIGRFGLYQAPSDVNAWTDSVVARVVASSDSAMGTEDVYARQFSLYGSVRAAILELLLCNIGSKKTVPTVAHLLLGFDLTRPISKMEFFPESEASTTSCFQVIVSLLLDKVGEANTNADINISQRSTFRAQFPTLAERCYLLIFRLVSDRYTSVPTLGYLRNVQNFFERQAKELSFVIGDDFDVDDVNESSQQTRPVAQVYQYAWLLKSIAVELHVSKAQHTVVSTLLQSLFGSINVSINAVNKQLKSTQPVSKMVKTAVALLSMTEGNAPPRASAGIDSAYYGVEYNKYIHVDNHQCTVYNIRAVADALFVQQRRLTRENRLPDQEVANLKREMYLVLLNLLHQNELRRQYAAKYCFFRAWKEVLDVVLLECFDSIDVASQQPFVTELINSILPFLSDPSLSIELKEVLAQAMVSLMRKLRHIGHLMPVNTGNNNFINEVGGALPIDEYHLMMRYMLSAIQQSETNEVVRGNLYAGLLTYLLATSQRVERKPMRDFAASLFNPTTSTVHAAVSMYQATTALSSADMGNLAILRSEGGERLLEVVCRDSASSVGPWNMVALALLDQLTELIAREKDNWVLVFLVRTNYLGQWINQLRRMGDDLVKIVTIPDFEYMTPFYLYDAIITLLIRIAQRHAGASRMLENRITSVLAEMEFIAHVPDTDSSMQCITTIGEASISEKYAHLLSLTTQLLAVMAAVLQRQHVSAVESIGRFVNINITTLNHILADKTHTITLSSLKQLCNVTSLLLYATNGRSQTDLRGVTSSITHISMLLLFSKYAFQENWSKLLVPSSDDERHLMEKRLPGYEFANKDMFLEKAQSIVYEICRNVLGYCRVATDPVFNGTSGSIKPTFLWSLAAARDNDYFQRPAASNPPTLGLLVNHLKSHLTRWKALCGRFADLQKKRETVNTLPSAELSAFLNNKTASLLNRSTQTVLVEQILSRLILDHLKEFTTSLSIIEQSLVLLWRHLDLYFGHLQTSTSVQTQEYIHGKRSRGLDELAESVASAVLVGTTRAIFPTPEELDVLKTDSATIVPGLVKRLNELDLRSEIVGVDKVEARRSFMAMLSRRIRDLAAKVQQAEF